MGDDKSNEFKAEEEVRGTKTVRRQKRGLECDESNSPAVPAGDRLEATHDFIFPLSSCIVHRISYNYRTPPMLLILSLLVKEAKLNSFQLKAIPTLLKPPLPKPLSTEVNHENPLCLQWSSPTPFSWVQPYAFFNGQFASFNGPTRLLH